MKNTAHILNLWIITVGFHSDICRVALSCCLIQTHWHYYLTDTSLFSTTGLPLFQVIEREFFLSTLWCFLVHQRKCPSFQLDFSQNCGTGTGDGHYQQHYIARWFISLHFITSWWKGNTYLVFLTADILWTAYWYCFWLTLVVTSISNSVLYHLWELHPSSLITPFLAFPWLCALCSCSVFLTLNSCQPVIITVRYRMSFSPILCTAHSSNSNYTCRYAHSTHTHTHSVK